MSMKHLQVNALSLKSSRSPKAKFLARKDNQAIPLYLLCSPITFATRVGIEDDSSINHALFRSRRSPCRLRVLRSMKEKAGRAENRAASATGFTVGFTQLATTVRAFCVSRP